MATSREQHFYAEEPPYNLTIVMTDPSLLFAAPLLSFALVLAMLWWLLKSSSLKVLDHPNPRSLHTTPVPRTGGVGLMLGVLVSWIFLSTALPLPVWAGVGLLVSVSFADDISGLPVGWRLLLHGVVAAWFAVALLLDIHGWVTVAVATVAIIWMTNLYNFMDGSNGLAGGMTLFGFGFYGLTAWLAGNEVFAVVNFCVAAAAAAFLLFNFHPARIFMGDAGAIPLGFLAATLEYLVGSKACGRCGCRSWCFRLLSLMPV